MTELDLEIPGLAFELIEEFGKVVIFSNVAEGPYNPETGTTSTTTIAASVKALVEPDKGQGVRAGLVESADYKLTVAAESLPTGTSTEDTVSFDNNDYKVVLVKGTYSGELVALYEIWIVSI